MPDSTVQHKCTRSLVRHHRRRAKTQLEYFVKHVTLGATSSKGQSQFTSTVEGSTIAVDHLYAPWKGYVLGISTKNVKSPLAYGPDTSAIEMLKMRRSMLSAPSGKSTRVLACVQVNLALDSYTPPSPPPYELKKSTPKPHSWYTTTSFTSLRTRSAAKSERR